MQPPPITKSQFKLGLDCIQKLRHAHNRLPESSHADEMLRLLAEGGAAVEALVQAIEPGEVIGGFGAEALERSRVAIDSALAAAAEGRTTCIYEATIEHGGFLARIDMLRIGPDRIDLVEIKAKSVATVAGAASDSSFLANNGLKVASEWLPYIQDLAFQRALLGRWLSEGREAAPRVHASLRLVDKQGRATEATRFDGANYRTAYRQGSRGIRATVEFIGSAVDAGLIVEVPADAALALIDADAQSRVTEFVGRGISDCMDAMQRIVAGNRWPDASRSFAPRCKSCEFRVGPGLESGFDRCWGPASERPRHHVLTAIRINGAQLEQAVEDAGRTASVLAIDAATLSGSQRLQHLALERGRPLVGAAFAADPLATLLGGEVEGPVHFVDFETSTYPIPSRAGGRPYRLIPFQFEGHTLPQPRAGLETRVRHDGFLDLERPDPQRRFIDALREQFGSSGPILHWHHYERTVLNGIKAELLGDDASSAEDQERIAFIDSLVGPRGKGDGDGRLVDMLPLAKRAFYHPDMDGSYSIKAVVPIAWSIPEIRRHFMAGHGASGDPDHYSGNTDPYDGLPAPPRSILEAVGGLEVVRAVIAATEDEGGAPSPVRNGGMAMLAYHHVRLFGGADADGVAEQLRRYCRLDSAAMVMVYAMMRDHVAAWGRS